MREYAAGITEELFMLNQVRTGCEFRLGELTSLAAEYFKHPNDVSVCTYTGHSVLQTLIRCNFSPIETTGQRKPFQILRLGRHSNQPVVVYSFSSAFKSSSCWKLRAFEIAGFKWTRPGLTLLYCVHAFQCTDDLTTFAK
jgi:hypothetical protein